MKERKENPYATVKGGQIKAPKKTTDQPKSVKITTKGDLRSKKG